MLCSGKQAVPGHATHTGRRKAGKEDTFESLAPATRAGHKAVPLIGCLLCQSNHSQC